MMGVLWLLLSKHLIQLIM